MPPDSSCVPDNEALPMSRNLPNVFPSYLSRIIQKKGWYAVVTLSFPSYPTNSSLGLQIDPKQVPHVAKELYGVHIDVEDGKRFLVLEDGVEVEIDTHIVLRRASNKAISKLYGKQVTMAYQSSYRYLAEQNLGEERTRCLTMVIDGKETSPGDLNLETDPKQLTVIRQDLFKETSGGVSLTA
ncbi:hypothetical protein JX266_014206 [Neoarthrinium moseri]|nr:hypothetical protein JX266_014392 [Neoarthrinium moseri]KAI1839584.1 hypothetical protein JX266_014206 [Neoarthrinium moseri]